MKAITLTQPWATLIAIGAKRIETRGWSTKYRGPLAIHAAAGLTSIGGKKGLADIVKLDPFYQHIRVRPEELPRSAIVAICDLVDCVPSERLVADGGAFGPGSTGTGRLFWALSKQERAFGDYSPGRYGWLLANVRAVRKPVPAKGALSLWEWEGGAQ